jgi:hypothetical protein
LQHKKRKKSERDKNMDKKMVMVKLIVQNKKKNRYSNHKKFSLHSKSSGIISLASNLGISRKGTAPLVQQPWVEKAGGFFFLSFCFPWSYGPSIASGNPEEASL